MSSFRAHSCYTQRIGANLIISAACSGVRSSTATLLIFTSWSPGSSRPSAGPPAHTQNALVLSYFRLSHGPLSRPRWTDDRRPPGFRCVSLRSALFRCVLLISFSSHTKAESFIQSISARTESNQRRCGRLAVSVCTFATCLAISAYAACVCVCVHGAAFWPLLYF